MRHSPLPGKAEAGANALWRKFRVRVVAKRTEGARMALRVPELTIVGGITFFAFGVATGTEPPVPDFAGNWARTTFALEQPDSGPGPVRTVRLRVDGSAQYNLGDEKSPILKPAAAAAVKIRNDMQVAGKDQPTPSNHCLPMVAPYVFRVQQMQMMQTKNEILILYMQDHQIRHVKLNASHPAHPTPTWYGDSTGHFEGDALVVDTIGFKVGAVAHLDSFGTPYSKDLHVVERYRLVDYETAKAAQDRVVRDSGPPATEQAAAIDPAYRGKGLQVRFTVEDKNYFTSSWSGAATYRKAGAAWVENVCAENIHEYYSGTETDVPRTDKPDF
jgi:hypothetical protein